MKGSHPSKTVFGKNLKSHTSKFTSCQGRAYPRRLVAVETKFGTAALNICGSIEWNLLFVVLLAPKLLCWLPALEAKLCIPVLGLTPPLI